MQPTQHPADNEFPYYLEVNDHHDSTDGFCEYPRYGWACLWRHEPDQPVSDANPYPEVYIQEQTFTIDDYTESHALSEPEFPIASPGVMYPYQIGDRNGWETGPSRLWDFIETVRDDYYEHGFDESDFPVRVITSRHEDTYPDSPFDEMCEIYFRNRENDLEFIMWNSNELYGPSGEANSELIQKILAEFAGAYEEPAAFLKKWGGHQIQIESNIDP